MVDIVQLCNNFNDRLSANETKADIMNRCVNQKLGNLYITQTTEYDNLIDYVDKMIERNDLSEKEMCRVVKKLSKNISSNRNQLINLIEELEG